MAKKKAPSASAPAAIAPLAPVVPKVTRLDTFDWDSIDPAPALPPEPDADKVHEMTMGHEWEAYLLAQTMTEWKLRTTMDLQYVTCHPVEDPAVLLLVPCDPETLGATLVAPDGAGARIRLQNALRKFQLSWGKDENIAFSVLIKETAKRGTILIVDVAGRKYKAIQRRTGKENTKAPKS